MWRIWALNLWRLRLAIFLHASDVNSFIEEVSIHGDTGVCVHILSPAFSECNKIKPIWSVRRVNYIIRHPKCIKIKWRQFTNVYVHHVYSGKFKIKSIWRLSGILDGGSRVLHPAIKIPPISRIFTLEHPESER